MGRRLLVALIMAGSALGVSGGTPAQSVLDRARRDDVVRMPSTDPAMAKAFLRAKASLDEFLAIAKSPPANTTGFSVKVAISDSRDTEYFWIQPFAEEAGSFRGKLNNTPRLVSHVRMGQEIRFRREEIVDWTYTDTAKKRMHGNFTACALLTRENPEDAAKFRKQFGLECDL
jgi:uncharacterized protein YegJ (DUF2314 family)